MCIYIDILCVIVGSGDLKRFHRRGDTSPCCSDLSLPTHFGSHHLPSPLLLNRFTLNTLQSTHNTTTACKRSTQHRHTKHSGNAQYACKSPLKTHINKNCLTPSFPSLSLQSKGSVSVPQSGGDTVSLQ